MRKKLVVVSAFMTLIGCETPTAPNNLEAIVASSPMAPSLTAVSRAHEKFAFEQTVNNTCAGEMVSVTGTLQVLDQVVTMDDGEIRTVFHTNFLGAVGVGLTSGKKYRAAIVDNSTWQGLPPGPPGGPWRTSHAGTLHLVIPGEGASMSWHFVFIVTKEPGSPLQLIVAKSDVSCH